MMFFAPLRRNVISFFRFVFGNLEIQQMHFSDLVVDFFFPIVEISFRQIFNNFAYFDFWPKKKKKFGFSRKCSNNCVCTSIYYQNDHKNRLIRKTINKTTQNNTKYPFSYVFFMIIWLELNKQENKLIL